MFPFFLPFLFGGWWLWGRRPRRRIIRDSWGVNVAGWAPLQSGQSPSAGGIIDWALYQHRLQADRWMIGLRDSDGQKQFYDFNGPFGLARAEVERLISEVTP